MKRVNQETGEIIDLPEPERKEHHHNKKHEDAPAETTESAPSAETPVETPAE